jgi:hypothetical protein
MPCITLYAILYRPSFLKGPVVPEVNAGYPALDRVVVDAIVDATVQVAVQHPGAALDAADA